MTSYLAKLIPRMIIVDLGWATIPTTGWAPPHFTATLREFLFRIFPDRWIGGRATVELTDNQNITH